MFTAASLNHKEARYQYSLFIENGIIPSPEIVEEVTRQGAKYHYLRHLVDTTTSLVFKYKPAQDSSFFRLSEFEADSRA